MPKNPLFSSYRTGENRVTASMLAVFERIDAGILERLVAAASGESTLPFIAFENQITGPESVPDAAISASFRYLFEVKTARGALGVEQLEHHLAILDGRHVHERLFAVTPDADEPAAIAALGDERLVWLSFRGLDQGIADILSDPSELIAEQTRFLLHELRALFAEEGLLGHDDTVVVAARNAYPEYLRISAYICQPGRSFRSGLERMGFYAEGAIQRELPRIRARRDNVMFSAEASAALRDDSEDPVDHEIAELVMDLSDDPNRGGQPYQVFLLSPPDGQETMRLPNVILNTKTDQHGRPWAWTLSQSYVRSEILLSGVQTTSELDDAHEGAH